ncbi:MAG: hypothetical protein JEZ12_25250 [Desulfobacterium sp.]|nr:hypothetical protein [Desulfobacterium sp.]
MFGENGCNDTWPNALGWFVVQNLLSFTPWHFLETHDEFSFAANRFQKEGLKKGQYSSSQADKTVMTLRGWKLLME